MPKTWMGSFPRFWVTLFELSRQAGTTPRGRLSTLQLQLALSFTVTS